MIRPERFGWGGALFGRQRSWLGLAAAVLWVSVLSLTLSWGASAQDLSVAETETLVRSSYFEGFPVEESARVSPAGAARLIEMLATPGDSRAHANVLVALGASGQPGALEAITTWAALPRSGEIDRDTFSAWQALPFALGHLAAYDRRAVARLEARLDIETPTFSFRHHRGARLHRLSRRASATALAMTGLPEAGRALDRAGRRGSDPDFDTHLHEVREMHQRRAARRRAR